MRRTINDLLMEDSTAATVPTRLHPGCNLQGEDKLSECGLSRASMCMNHDCDAVPSSILSSTSPTETAEPVSNRLAAKCQRKSLALSAIRYAPRIDSRAQLLNTNAGHSNAVLRAVAAQMDEQ